LLGSLLAWRLATMPAARAASVGIELWTGGNDDRAKDATTHSGGLVRAYADSGADSRLAARSLAELRSSPTLREWAGYQEVGSVVVLDGRSDPAEALAVVDDLMPGHVRLADPAELERRFSLGNLPEGSFGIVEEQAGYVFPDRLRDALLAHLPTGRVQLQHRSVDSVDPRPAVRPAGGGAARCYDAVILATGPWTAAVLARGGLAGAVYQTKQIQYTWCTGWPDGLGGFVDETSGLYGRPAAGGGMIGVPTDRWGVDPSDVSVCDRATRQLRDAVKQRLPGAGGRALTLGLRTVPALDCFCQRPGPGAALRPVVDGSALYTFSGGSGGAVKTVLAASRDAARAVLETLLQPDA